MSIQPNNKDARSRSRSVYLLHFNIRRNGGNLVLSRFANDLANGLDLPLTELSLRLNLFKIMSVLFSRDIVVFSNPILLLLFFMKKSSVHFIQSIDEELFSPEDFGLVKAGTFKVLVLFCMRFSRSIRVFNSKFTQQHYRSLKRTAGLYETEHNLYYAAFKSMQLEGSVEKQPNQCVWIGTKHSRKGFSDVVAMAQSAPEFSFKCIFSGQYPNTTDLPANMHIYCNLAHDAVVQVIKDSAISVVTSSFESLSLPVYEGLLFGNKVIAKSSRYLEANTVEPYVSTYSDPRKVTLGSLEVKQKFEFHDPAQSNATLIRAISCAI